MDSIVAKVSSSHLISDFSNMQGFTHSVLSGIMAATASLFGKLAMDSDALGHLVPYLVKGDQKLGHWYTVIRALLLVLMVLTNTVMWTMFTKALVKSRTSLEATVVNTAANFIFTAIFGTLLFDETIGFLWFLGSIMILIGLILVKMGADRQRKKR
ncbi:hypothetical protein HDE_04430 [Halotydeus destructor]|nr:hypothetical protein HDE_04430 [Halotydeus destructor]